MSQTFNAAVSVVGINIGKNSSILSATISVVPPRDAAGPCRVPEANIQTGRIA
ncbi:hypothetical protein [Bradyrhizobium sp.]|jgi:hypothetical protein|uniref:hypothetical protein n=1 Tax=Bradyrhizobium sp. TaxID=376 RepID=UPI003C71BEE1